MPKFYSSTATVSALSAAFLFGASTPFAKQLVGEISPLLLAGLLYLGSGLGLGLVKLIRDKNWYSGLAKNEWCWLLGAILFGGIVAPILLMLGLTKTSASIASLLLNLESVLTAVIAWNFFKEHTDKRMMLAMFLIVAGGILLSWSKQTTLASWMGPIAIAAAWLQMSYALLVGFLGYGVSLVLFILALRGLGTARAGAYFSTAPFIGAAIAIVFFHDPTSFVFWIADFLMAMGVWIHLTEYHEHVHTHEAFFHDHSHIHDEHLDILPAVNDGDSYGVQLKTS